MMSDRASHIRERASAVFASGALLRATALERRIDWLASAADRLTCHAIEGREHLAAATGLSSPMVEWGVRTTLDTVQPDALRALASEAESAIREPLSFLPVILAGNLFTAAVRAVFVPLLVGVPVLAKASSRESAFPQMLAEVLVGADSELGNAMDVVVFPGGELDAETAMTASAEAIAVYGGDDTVEAIRARHPTAALIPHAHGVSAAYCGREALTPAKVEETIAAIALDVCAYDQRGCLSPQVVYVEETSTLTARTFAKRLAKGLRSTGERLPRGPLPAEVGAAQAQWRGLAEVEGALFEGPTCAVSVKSDPHPRWSPGYRNVAVTPVQSLSQAVQAMSSFSAHLKCVGVDSASMEDVAAELARSGELDAYPCPLGTMQTPALDAPADGRPIWHGLGRA